jgi:hypothetical protein
MDQGEMDGVMGEEAIKVDLLIHGKGKEQRAEKAGSANRGE